MIAGMASRHMYSMGSWSPSQSDPLTVSYMCQRQSSSPMLPSAAAMPPCAATVCERVGKTLVMQAVFRPASLAPTPPRSPEPHAPPPPASAAPPHAPEPGPASSYHDDVVAVFGDRIGAPVDLRRVSVAAVL